MTTDTDHLRAAGRDRGDRDRGPVADDLDRARRAAPTERAEQLEQLRGELASAKAAALVWRKRAEEAEEILARRVAPPAARADLSGHDYAPCARMMICRRCGMRSDPVEPKACAVRMAELLDEARVELEATRGERDRAQVAHAREYERAESLLVEVDEVETERNKAETLVMALANALDRYVRRCTCGAYSYDDTDSEARALLQRAREWALREAPRAEGETKP